jgi:hypothetical protein
MEDKSEEQVVKIGSVIHSEMQLSQTNTFDLNNDKVQKF